VAADAPFRSSDDEGTSAGIDVLGRRHEVEHHSFEGAGPSRYMHIELLEEEIAQLCRFPRQS
jgi:hypothetical protein